MEIFSITCTTCRAKLKVRDPEVIGDILACPKCQGMVLVEAPAGWQGGNIAPAVTNKTKQAASKHASIRDTVDSDIATQTAPAESSPTESSPTESSPTESSPTESTPSKFDTSAFPEEMLQSAPPRSSGANQADGDAPTVESLDVDFENRESSVESPNGESAPADETTGDVEVGDVSETVDSSISVRDDHLEPAPQSEGEELPDLDAAPGPLLPNDQWVSPATHQRKQIMLMVGASVGGVIVALAVFGIALSQIGGAGGQPVAGVNPGSDVIHVDAAPLPGNTKLRATVAATGSPKTVKSPTGPATDSGADSPDPEKPIAATPDPDTPPPATAGKPVPADPAAKPEPENTPPAADGAEDVGGDLELDPAAAAETEQPPGLEDILGDFAPFMEDTPVAPPIEDAGEDPEPAGPEIEPVDPSRPPAPEPLKVDIAARLADKIPAIAFEAAELVEFVRLMSDLTNIPISIDPVGLKMAVRSTDSKVRVKLKDASVKDILVTALRPLGLALEEGKDHLVVAYPGGSRQGENSYATTGLASNTADLKTLASIATDVVAAPSTWEEYGGTASLNIKGKDLVLKHQMPVHFQLLLLLEKLRVARGAATTTRLDPNLFLMQTRRSQAADGLNKKLNINYHELTGLVKVLRRIEQASGLTLLVDWPAMLQKGWNPATEASLTVENETTAATLMKLLEPYGATFKVIDATTLQITTVEHAAAENEIELYSVAGLLPKDASPQPLLNRIRIAAGAGNFRTADGVAVLRYDPVSRCIIAAAPQSVQMKIESLLKGWAKTAG